MEANSCRCSGPIHSDCVQWDMEAPYYHTDTASYFLDRLVGVSTQITYMVYQITEMSKIICDLRRENTELKIRLNENQIASNCKRTDLIDNRSDENNSDKLQPFLHTAGCDGSKKEQNWVSHQLQMKNLNKVSEHVKDRDHGKSHRSTSLNVMLRVRFKRKKDRAKKLFERYVWVQEDRMKSTFNRPKKLFRTTLIYGHAPKTRRYSNMQQIESKINDRTEEKIINADLSPSESDGGQGGRLSD